MTSAPGLFASGVFVPMSLHRATLRKLQAHFSKNHVVVIRVDNKALRMKQVFLRRGSLSDFRDTPNGLVPGEISRKPVFLSQPETLFDRVWKTPVGDEAFSLLD